MRTDSDLSALRWDAGALNNGLIFGATYHLVTRLPRSCSYGIGHACTWLAYRLLRQGTGALVDNLRVIRPKASERDLQRLALLTYRTYARDTIDFIRSLEMNRTDFIRSFGELDTRPFDQLLHNGRGIIVLGGHFGNWEIGGVALRLVAGYPLTVVGKPEASPIVGQLRRRMRVSLGIETLEIGHMLETALQIRRLLDSNGIVAMLLDRHIGRDRVDVEFFGRRASFLRSPAMIGYLSGAPLLPSFMVREKDGQKDGRFTGYCGSPIFVDTTKPTEEAVQTATQAFARQLEAEIRTYPHLWYQFYPYWREQDRGQPATA